MQLGNTIKSKHDRIGTIWSGRPMLAVLIGRSGGGFTIQGFQGGRDAPFVGGRVGFSLGAAFQNIQGGRHDLIQAGRLGSSPTRAVRPSVQNRGSEPFHYTFAVDTDTATIESVPSLVHEHSRLRIVGSASGAMVSDFQYGIDQSQAAALLFGCRSSLPTLQNGKDFIPSHAFQHASGSLVLLLSLGSILVTYYVKWVSRKRTHIQNDIELRFTFQDVHHLFRCHETHDFPRTGRMVQNVEVIHNLHARCRRVDQNSPFPFASPPLSCGSYLEKSKDCKECQREQQHQFHWTPPTRPSQRERHTNESVGITSWIPFLHHSSGYDDETPKNDGFDILDGAHRIDGEKDVLSVRLSGVSIRIFASCNTSVISDRVMRRSRRSAFPRDSKLDLRALQRRYTKTDIQKNTRPIIADTSPINVNHISHKSALMNKAQRTLAPTLDIRFSSGCCVNGRMVTSFTGSRERMPRTLRAAMKLNICSGISGWLKMRGSSTIRSVGKRRSICFARSTSSRYISPSLLITRTANTAEQVTKTKTERKNSASTFENLASPPRNVAYGKPFRGRVSEQARVDNIH